MNGDRMFDSQYRY